MSILDIAICITVFIITLLLVRGIVIRIWAFFSPIEYIQLSTVDEHGIEHTKKLYVKDDKLIDEILKIRKKQKLAQGDHSAK